MVRQFLKFLGYYSKEEVLLLNNYCTKLEQRIKGLERKLNNDI